MWLGVSAVRSDVNRPWQDLRRKFEKALAEALQCAGLFGTISVSASCKERERNAREVGRLRQARCSSTLQDPPESA